MTLIKNLKFITYGLLSFLISMPIIAGSENVANLNNGLFAISGAIAIGIAAMGGALGQGKVASAALEGIARNPEASDKIFVPMILCMALVESLVLFSLLIAFMILGKIS